MLFSLLGLFAGPLGCGEDGGEGGAAEVDRGENRGPALHFDVRHAPVSRSTPAGPAVGNHAEPVLREWVIYGAGEAGGSGAGAVRLFLRFDGMPAMEREESVAPNGAGRWLAFDFPNAGADESLGTRLEVGNAGLVRVRRVPRDAGFRIVVELAEGADRRVLVLADPFRILLDVAPTRRPAEQETPEVRVVLIDPGHGGDDFGARYEGLHEAEVALDIAKRAAFVLRRRLPQARVLLTRDDDRFVTLEQRTAMANAIDADVFVSVHLNAADEPVDHGGVSTFVLDVGNDRQALRLAARENGTTPAEVHGLERLLADLHREGQVAESRRLAARVQASTLLGGRRFLPALPDRGVKSAMFYVLVGATMPAILVEASFLTKPDEAAALRRVDYRQALAEGIADGIVRYSLGLAER